MDNFRAINFLYIHSKSLAIPFHLIAIYRIINGHLFKIIPINNQV